MTPRIQHDTSAQRGRGDSGAALVEFALVSVLLFTLVFGIINFGLLLSFKQDMTRAAAEGARAGAVAQADDDAVALALAATEDAVEGFGKTCHVDGMVCTVTQIQVDCDGDGASTETCDAVSVELDFNYKDNPLLPDMPLISAFMPDHVRAVSVARENT